MIDTWLEDVRRQRKLPRPREREAVRRLKMEREAKQDATFAHQTLAWNDWSWVTESRRMTIDEALASQIAVDALVELLRKHGFCT